MSKTTASRKTKNISMLLNSIKTDFILTYINQNCIHNICFKYQFINFYLFIYLVILKFNEKNELSFTKFTLSLRE